MPPGPTIKNVVFDVGNVMVRWSPLEVVARVFAHVPESVENVRLANAIFLTPTWRALNRGEITQEDAEAIYQRDLKFSAAQTAALFHHIFEHQTPLEGSEPLARRLKGAGYRIFALTDNVREIVAYYKANRTFWDVFEGAVVSAEIGLTKPSAEIFQHLLTTHAIEANETVFFDDVPANIRGAEAVGINARLFTTAQRAELDLRQMGASF